MKYILYHIVVYLVGWIGILIDLNFRFHQHRDGGGTIGDFWKYLVAYSSDVLVSILVYTGFYALWWSELFPTIIQIVTTKFPSWKEFLDAIGLIISGRPNFATLAWGLGSLELFEWVVEKFKPKKV